MKFLCVPCNEPMKLQETDPIEGESISLNFLCPSCGNNVAMLTNTGETQLVQSLGVRFGSSNGSISPMAALRSQMAEGKASAMTEDVTPEPSWSKAAEARIAKHPRFLQPVIRKTCSDYARQEGIEEISPEVMDAAQRVLVSK